MAADTIVEPQKKIGFLQRVFENWRSRAAPSASLAGRPLVEVAEAIKESKSQENSQLLRPVAFSGAFQTAAGGVQASRPQSHLQPPPSASEVSAALSVSSGGASGASVDDAEPGFTAEHAAGISARLHTFTQDELQTALDLVPQSFQRLRWDLANRLNSGEAPASTGDLASMTHAELEAALVSETDNARRYEIAARLNAGAPMVPGAELANLTADEIRERLSGAKDNQERWDLAKALERADSLDGMTAEQLEAGLASATNPMERGRYAFAIAALNS